MLIRDIADCSYHRMMDRSILCELLHPDQVREVEDLPCSIAHVVIPPGESTLPHRLRTSTELYYILTGTGRMHIGSEAEEILPGKVVLIPPQALQYIENNGTTDLCFLCIVTPPWRAGDEELVL